MASSHLSTEGMPDAQNNLNSVNNIQNSNSNNNCLHIVLPTASNPGPGNVNPSSSTPLGGGDASEDESGSDGGDEDEDKLQKKIKGNDSTAHPTQFVRSNSIYSEETRFKILKEALENFNINQVANKYNVNPSLLRRWRK